MSSIFLAIPQYKVMPEAEISRISVSLGIEDYEPVHKGFHPMVDLSIQRLTSSGHNVAVCVVNGDGNLPRVRSFQAGIWKANWDEGKKCDYFLIVDDDISFSPEDVDTLINDDKPIVGGIYTFKTLKEPYYGRPVTKLWEGQHGTLKGPFQVRWLNGGFILIKAEALLALIDHYKDLEFDLSDDSPMQIKKAWGLWIPRIYQENGDRAFLSEDYAFCQRAREAGFDIWADWRCRLIHWSADAGYTITAKEGKAEHESAVS